MPRPAQIPDLERQVGNIIGRVEALERKRPEWERPPDPPSSGGLPDTPTGYAKYQANGARSPDGSSTYGTTDLPVGSLFHVTWTLTESAGTAPFTLGSPAHYLDYQGGWTQTIVSFAFKPISGTLTGGLAYTYAPAYPPGDDYYFTQQVAGSAIGTGSGTLPDGLWAGSMSYFTRWPTPHSNTVGLFVSLTGSGTAGFHTFGIYGTRYQATGW